MPVSHYVKFDDPQNLQPLGQIFFRLHFIEIERKTEMNLTSLFLLPKLLSQLENEAQNYGCIHTQIKGGINL